MIRKMLASVTQRGRSAADAVDPESRSDLQALAEHDVAAAADAVWAVLSDVAGWPAWMEGVQHAEVLDAAPDGSSVEVRLHNAVPGGTAVSTWRYTLDASARTLTWAPADPETHGYLGDYAVTDRGDGASAVRYRLTVPAGEPQAAAVARYLEQHSMPDVLLALERRTLTAAA